MVDLGVVSERTFVCDLKWTFLRSIFVADRVGGNQKVDKTTANCLRFGQMDVVPTRSGRCVVDPESTNLCIGTSYFSLHPKRSRGFNTMSGDF